VGTFLRAAAIVSLVTLLLGTGQVFSQGRSRVETRDQILELLVKEDKALQECVEKSGGPGRTFKIEQLDLNRDKSKEIMVRGISPCVCGPRRCLNRIYRQDGARLELLLSADFAQQIEPQDLYTNGYRNLWAAVYMYHSFTSVLYEYQYDGKQYKWDHCVMRFYYYSEKVKGVHFSGRVRYHEKPSISWVGCNSLNPFGP
jgi:hypothetical protein